MGMMFARITKVDEAKREVWGRATQEVVDKSNEIFDYESSVPYFKAWSEGFAKDTDGRSLGNVRSMHGKVAAGKVIKIDYVDTDKAIDVGVKVVDDNEWAKVLEGVHTGFSIGGSYEKRWDDAATGAKRFTANPNEISLVDSPCVPTAKFFDVYKASGDIEQRAFKVAERSDTNPKEGESEYGDVAFADEKNKKYPIDTEAHIRAAWNYINKPRNSGKYSEEDVKSIKAKIVAAWKKVIDKDGPPSAKKLAEGALKKYGEHQEVFDASTALNALCSLTYLYESEKAEQENESDQLVMLGTAIKALRAFVASEIMEPERDEVMAMFAEPAGLEKGDFVGHPFRGNQYQAGSGISDLGHSRSALASKLTNEAHKNPSKESHMKAAEMHQKAAASTHAHGRTSTAEYHNAMATYHLGRASHYTKADGIDSGTNADHDNLAKAHGMLADLHDQNFGAMLGAAGELGKCFGTMAKDDADMEMSEPSGDLQKAQTDLQKLQGENEALRKQLEGLKKLPEPPKPVSSATPDKDLMGKLAAGPSELEKINAMPEGPDKAKAMLIYRYKTGGQ